MTLHLKSPEKQAEKMHGKHWFKEKKTLVLSQTSRLAKTINKWDYFWVDTFPEA